MLAFPWQFLNIGQWYHGAKGEKGKRLIAIVFSGLLPFRLLHFSPFTHQF
jgi:hypothetical protein